MARYSDIDLDFKAHPVSGDIVTLTDMEALKRSVRNLVLTKRYDRPFRPELDAGVHQYLFELATPVTSIKIKNKIEETIRRDEPRVELLDVVVTSVPERNAFTVSIVFRPVNVRNTATVTLNLERTR